MTAAPQVIVSVSGGVAETVYSSVDTVVVDWDDIRDGDTLAIDDALDRISDGHPMRDWLLKHLAGAGVNLADHDIDPVDVSVAAAANLTPSALADAAANTASLNGAT